MTRILGPPVGYLKTVWNPPLDASHVECHLPKRPVSSSCLLRSSSDRFGKLSLSTREGKVHGRPSSKRILGRELPICQQHGGGKDIIISHRTIGDIVTATRLKEGGSTLRVLGPELGENAGGIGRLLSVDEFFGTPDPTDVRSPNPPPPGTLPEALIYYFDDPEDEYDDADLARPAASQDLTASTSARPGGTSSGGRHGIYLQLTSAFKPLATPAHPMMAGPLLAPPPLVHVRESAFTASVAMRSWEGKGEEGGGEFGGRRSGEREGATVRVVAGECGGSRAPPPLDDFMLLDVSMRPGSQAEIPLPASLDLLLYIVEGVGIFGPESAGGTAGTSYQNEGHSLRLPPLLSAVQSDATSSLLVRASPWSHLRFIVAGARPL